MFMSRFIRTDYHAGHIFIPHRTKAMAQSEILRWRVASRAHAIYGRRHGQIWGLLFVKVLNLFQTTSQCTFISGALRKLLVSIVKINCLSSFLSPLKVIDVGLPATLHQEVTRYKVR